MLEQILKEIEETEKIANLSLDSVDYATQSAWGAAKGQAQRQLEVLKNKYMDVLFDTIECVGVLGEGSPNGIPVNTQLLYEELATPIETMFQATRSRLFTSEHIDILTNIMYEVGKDLGVEYFYPIGISAVTSLNSWSELREFVKDVVRKAVGDDFNKLYIRNYLKNACLGGKVSKPNLILLLNASEDELKELGSLFRQFSIVTNPGVEKEEDTAPTTTFTEPKTGEPKLKKLTKNK